MAGWYGSADGYGQNLLVHGGQFNPVPAGTPLRFYIDGVRAECQEQVGATLGAWGLTYPFASTTTRLNLRLVSPVLRISKLNNTTARLEWDAMLETPEVEVSYELYRSSTEPYFEPPNAVDVPDYPKTIANLSFDDTAAAGNHYYLLKTLYSDDAVGRGMSSTRVGKFDFSLTPGS